MIGQSSHIHNETAAAAAFSEQAPLFDGLYGEDAIIAYKRERVRSHVLNFLQPQAEILELNAGTGEDAVFFAARGHTVHATDISEAMQMQLKEKAKKKGLHIRISDELCSYNRLDDLRQRGPYDLIFSNFAGLNCTGELGNVLRSFDPLLKPGGYITLVILPPFCLWEFLLLFRGRFRTAFRRFSGKKGSTAHVEGHYFTCWYYRPSFITKTLGPGYRLIAQEGLCSLVPPSYMENFAGKYPRSFRFLKSLESRLRSSWPWKHCGDYYIITLQKK